MLCALATAPVVAGWLPEGVAVRVAAAAVVSLPAAALAAHRFGRDRRGRVVSVALSACLAIGMFLSLEFSRETGGTGFGLHALLAGVVLAPLAVVVVASCFPPRGGRIDPADTGAHGRGGPR